LPTASAASPVTGPEPGTARAPPPALDYATGKLWRRAGRARSRHGYARTIGYRSRPRGGRFVPTTNTVTCEYEVTQRRNAPRAGPRQNRGPRTGRGHAKPLCVRKRPQA